MNIREIAQRAGVYVIDVLPVTCITIPHIPLFVNSFYLIYLKYFFHKLLILFHLYETCYTICILLVLEHV